MPVHTNGRLNATLLCDLSMHIMYVRHTMHSRKTMWLARQRYFAEVGCMAGLGLKRAPRALCTASTPEHGQQTRNQYPGAQPAGPHHGKNKSPHSGADGDDAATLKETSASMSPKSTIITFWIIIQKHRRTRRKTKNEEMLTVRSPSG